MKPDVPGQGDVALRWLAPGDAEALYAIRSRPEVVRYTGVPLYKSAAEAEDYIVRMTHARARGSAYTWAIWPQDAAQMAGTVCLWNPNHTRSEYDLGYELTPAWRGQGLAGRAAAQVLDYAYDTLGLSWVLADPIADNTASVRVLEKLGFAPVLRPGRPGAGCLLLGLNAPQHPE